MIRNVEYADRKKLQKTYLDGLRRYKCRGIPIIIDGEECPEKDWERIFEMSEDGGFYMGDYVGAEQGCLREIDPHPLPEGGKIRADARHRPGGGSLCDAVYGEHLKHLL